MYNPSHTKLANTTLVRSIARNVSEKSNASPSNFTATGGSTGKSTPSGGQPYTEISGLENLRKNMASEGISMRATELIAGARRTGSIANYESAWRKWASWCNKQQVDSFKFSVAYVLDFLAYLEQLKYEYSTINCHRSAISAYHELVNKTPVGQHIRVCQLMTGIYNKNPPKPRHTFVWDVEQVLSYLDKLPDNTNLSDGTLTLKLTMLLALASAGREAELKMLHSQYMASSHTSCFFWFPKLTKTSKKGQSSKKLEFYKFSPNKKLCVVDTIKAYLDRSKPWCGETKNQLLLNSVKPHNEVTSSTISGWVKAILKAAGIDTNIFKAHSCRAASTSKAKVVGLSMEGILERAVVWKVDMAEALSQTSGELCTRISEFRVLQKH